MNKIDKLAMTLSRQLEYHFYKFLYFFMFRDCKNCKSFCLTCKEFDKCMETVKRTYKSVHTFGLSNPMRAQIKVINKNSPVNDSKGTKPVIDRTIFVY